MCVGASKPKSRENAGPGEVRPRRRHGPDHPGLEQSAGGSGRSGERSARPWPRLPEDSPDEKFSHSVAKMTTQASPRTPPVPFAVGKARATRHAHPPGYPATAAEPQGVPEIPAPVPPSLPRAPVAGPRRDPRVPPTRLEDERRRDERHPGLRHQTPGDGLPRRRRARHPRGRRRRPIERGTRRSPRRRAPGAHRGSDGARRSSRGTNRQSRRDGGGDRRRVNQAPQRERACAHRRGEGGRGGCARRGRASGPPQA